MTGSRPIRAAAAAAGRPIPGIALAIAGAGPPRLQGIARPAHVQASPGPQHTSSTGGLPHLHAGSDEGKQTAA